MFKQVIALPLITLPQRGFARAGARTAVKRASISEHMSQITKQREQQLQEQEQEEMM